MTTQQELVTHARQKLAAAAGLGQFERGQPWGSGYNQINYSKIEL